MIKIMIYVKNSKKCVLSPILYTGFYFQWNRIDKEKNNCNWKFELYRKDDSDDSHFNTCLNVKIGSCRVASIGFNINDKINLENSRETIVFEILFNRYFEEEFKKNLVDVAGIISKSLDKFDDIRKNYSNYFNVYNCTDKAFQNFIDEKL